MFIKWPVIYFCAFAYVLNKVNAQICKETFYTMTVVEETFLATFIETYNGQCPYGCIKTRQATSVSHKSVLKNVPFTVTSCCTGYKEVDSINSDSDIECEPICEPCGNGYCKAPLECACNAGYVPDPTVKHNCIPSCALGCEHGRCVAPDTCRCDEGYEFVNTTCQTVGTSREQCQNGTCLALETYVCLPGYKKSSQNACEPYCSKGCDKGLCAEPETCLCNPGWQFKEGKAGQNGRCEPVCSKPCANGICVAPDTCECKGAYTKSKSGICEPVCTPPCGNGACIAPQTCSCFPGYHVGTDSIYSLLDSPHLTGCTPTCTRCRDSYCIAPEKCLLETPSTSFVDYSDIYDDYYSGIFDDIIATKKAVTSKNTYSDAFHKSTRPDVTDTDIIDYSYGTSTADDVDTETIKNSVDKIIYPDDKRTETMNIVPSAESTNSNEKNTVTYSKDAQKQTWLQHNWLSIFIPLLVIVTAVAIMLLVWRLAPIIIFFKGRSYVVEGDPIDINVSRPFEDIQISVNENKKTAEK